MTSTGRPASEYFTALSRRLVIAPTTCDRVTEHHEILGDVADAQGDAECERQGAHALGRFFDEHTRAHRLTNRLFLRLDLAQIQEVVDDVAQAVGLTNKLLGEPAADLHVVAREERLGKQAHRPNRGLELVTDIRHEVAAHALHASKLGDVLHVGHRTNQRPVVGAQRVRVHHEGLARWAEQRDLLDPGLTAEGTAHQAVDELLRNGVAVTGVAEPLGGTAARELVPGVVDHDDSGCRCLHGLDEKITIRRRGVRRALGFGEGDVEDVVAAAPSQPNRPVM